MVVKLFVFLFNFLHAFVLKVRVLELLNHPRNIIVKLKTLCIVHRKPLMGLNPDNIFLITLRITLIQPPHGDYGKGNSCTVFTSRGDQT